MGSRDAEHEAWNLEHGLSAGESLPLFCPRCARPHVETLTNVPTEPDYLHHVHQCTVCGLRFDVYVRTRSTFTSTETSEAFVRVVGERNAERRSVAQIVEWLRASAPQPEGEWSPQRHYAECIERGDWKRADPPGNITGTKP